MHLILMVLLSLSAPGDAPLLVRLKVGAELVVELLPDTFDEATGVRVRRVDDGAELALSWDQLVPEDVDVQVTMINAGAWYNHYFDKKSRKGLALSTGFSVDFRKTAVQVDPGVFVNDLPEAEISDFIFKYFVSAGYRF